MKTKILTYEAAKMVRDNFRWFAGFKVRFKKLGPDRYMVKSPAWCWSHIVLYEKDYAYLEK